MGTSDQSSVISDQLKSSCKDQKDCGKKKPCVKPDMMAEGTPEKPSKEGETEKAAQEMTKEKSEKTETAPADTGKPDTGTVGDDGIWRPSAGENDGTDDLWKPPVDGENEDDEVWKPSESTDSDLPGFADKGIKDAAVDDKKQYDILTEYRTTSVLEEALNPELDPIAEKLLYVSYYQGLTSTTSLQVEGQRTATDSETNSNWIRADWAKLLDTEARIDVELASLWASDDTVGYRSAFTYGWPAGLNLDLSVRLQVSEVEDVWGYQVEAEGYAYLSSTTALKGKSYYYWDGDDNKSNRSSLILAQYLGFRTGLHVDLNLGHAWAEQEEASYASYRIEVRHRLGEYDTLLKAAYLHYYDSWQISADSYSFRVEQPIKDGTVGIGYRVYSSDEGYEAATWMMSIGYMW